MPITTETPAVDIDTTRGVCVWGGGGISASSMCCSDLSNPQATLARRMAPEGHEKGAVCTHASPKDAIKTCCSWATQTVPGNDSINPQRMAQAAPKALAGNGRILPQTGLMNTNACHPRLDPKPA